jgi:hypothetical protein
MSAPTNHGRLSRPLILCGLLSSILYVVIDLVGARNYPGYDYSAQAISEMSALGAPTSELLAPFYKAWSLLFIAFTAGVWFAGKTRRPLRWSAGFMLGIAIVGSGFALFPMSQRSAEPTGSDTMHLVVAGAIMILLSAAILTGGRAFDRGFRVYSATTVAVMLLFFTLTMRDVPNVAADLPTPFMGLNERVSMAAWLLWMAVLSIQLLRTEKGDGAPSAEPVNPIEVAAP